MDIERAAVDCINASDVGAKAYYDVPADRPKAFVVIERTGGSRGEAGTSRPTIDAQCWAQTRREAATLAEAVSDALEVGLPAMSEDVASARVSSEFRDYDLESWTPRYHLVVEMTANR